MLLAGQMFQTVDAQFREYVWQAVVRTARRETDLCIKSEERALWANRVHGRKFLHQVEGRHGRGVFAADPLRMGYQPRVTEETLLFQCLILSMNPIHTDPELLTNAVSGVIRNANAVSNMS